MGFSPPGMAEFFVFRKNGDMRNKKPPAMRVVQQMLIAQSPFRSIIEVSKPHYYKKGKVINMANKHTQSGCVSTIFGGYLGIYRFLRL